jgi:hypothetical protein
MSLLLIVPTAVRAFGSRILSVDTDVAEEAEVPHSFLPPPKHYLSERRRATWRSGVGGLGRMFFEGYNL